MNQMKIGVLADCLRVGVFDAILKARELGAQGVQIYAVDGEMAPWNLSAAGRRELLDCARSSGMAISALCGDLGPPGFTNGADNGRRIDMSRRIMDLARDLDCAVVTTHIGVVPADANHPRREVMQRACEAIGEYADSVGAAFAIETGPETAAVLRGFLDSLRCKGVRVNLDPANLVMCTGDDPVRAVFELKDYIVHTHAKDGRLLKPGDMDVMYGTWGVDVPDGFSDWDYCAETPLGEGDVDFDRYLAALDGIGYAGYLTIERETGDSPERDIALAAGFLRGKLDRLYAKK
jgi:sugar phosphate isomerase/epimerase